MVLATLNPPWSGLEFPKDHSSLLMYLLVFFKDAAAFPEVGSIQGSH